MRSDIPWSQAACKASVPEVEWFPKKPTGSASPRERAEYERAVLVCKTICHDCPVREACLRLGIEVSPTFGIWGGTTPEERNGRRNAG